MHPSKKTLGLLWLLAGCLGLSGCTGGIPLQEETPTTTLPPSAVQYVAPIGDASLEYTAEATLFLPRHDSSRLLAITENVVFSATRPQAESVVRALLTHEGNGMVTPVGGNVRLSLYGANPVEVSRDVVTVNLAASALQLDRKAFYLACQAISDTLTRLTDIHYVNLLVMDRQIGLDIASTLPTGTFSRSVGEDIGAVYEQALSQRVSANESAATKQLTSMATLYFPLQGHDGVMPEVRSITFGSQQPSSMVQRLLQELSTGPQQLTGSPALPLLADLLTAAPTVGNAPDGGGQVITLRFSSTFDDMLSAFQLTRANCMASLCYTLTTFIPDAIGLCVYIGDELVQSVPLSGLSPTQPAILFSNGVQRRAEYSTFLLNHCTLYFANDAKQTLVSVQRAVPYYQTTNPRALLLELAKGPQPQDSRQDTAPIMETGAISDSDMLGFSLSGNTLLVNFATTFGLLGKDISPQEDRLLAYGLVNTLSALPRIQRVCFFVSGDLPMDFTGEIYWAGDFYKNFGLMETLP